MSQAGIINVIESNPSIPTLFNANVSSATPIFNELNIYGATVPAGPLPPGVLFPVYTLGSGNTITVNVQIADDVIASDPLAVGLAAFNSSQFTVDANGFVSLLGGGLAVDSFTPDNGTSPVVPNAAGNVSILGLSGSKVTGGTNTLTIKSPPFSQIGASATSSLNTGEFITAAVTRTLPASAGLADGDLFIYVCTTTNALVIQSVSAQRIRIGSLISSAPGTATSTSIGDSVTLRFNATDGFFYAVSVIGTWVLT